MTKKLLQDVVSEHSRSILGVKTVLVRDNTGGSVPVSACLVHIPWTFPAGISRYWLDDGMVSGVCAMCVQGRLLIHVG